MKRAKKILSLVLSAVLLFSVLPMAGFAEETLSVKMLSYNVAGLPSFDKLLGRGGTDVPHNQTEIGRQVNLLDCDLIAVQEDFGYHAYLARELTNTPYRTAHTGGVPGGDGMNVFSKTPVYNVKRTAWEQSYGVINDGADQLTPKGILYTLVDLGNGIFVDLYDIHADAYDGEGSIAARNDNFRQLAELIKARGNARPVIVTGDFNISSHHSTGKELTRYLIRESGLKDAWTELYNGGDYEDYTEYFKQYGYTQAGYWGIWDSVEKFLYRDGGGVHVEPTDFAYIRFEADGASLSDHSAVSAVFTFTKTDGFSENTEALRVPSCDPLGSFLNSFRVTLSDLFLIFHHLDELFAFIKG